MKRKWAALVISAVTLPGCSTPPPLDQARVTVVASASAEDLQRLDRAKENQRHRLFGGAWFASPGHDARFSKEEYDAYLSYLNAHPELVPPEYRPPFRWPYLHVAFRTTQPLVKPDPSDPTPISAAIYYCSADPKAGSWTEILYAGEFLSGQTSPPTAPTETEYEIIAPYRHRAIAAVDEKSVILLPPPDDLCLAIESPYVIGLPSTRGLPLRIAKVAVETALSPLP